MNPPKLPRAAAHRGRAAAAYAAAAGLAALAGWAAVADRPSPAPAVSGHGHGHAHEDSSHGHDHASTTAAAAQKTPRQVLDAIPGGDSAAAASKVDAEIARFKKLALAKPAEPTAWVGLGDALMQKARESAEPHFYDHAEKAYGRALDVAPRTPEALLGMAWVSGARHEFPDSVAWARKALAIAPGLHAAHGLIGDAHVETGDYEAAFDSYQAMLDIRPDISSYSRGAHLLFLTGDTRKAVWLMEKAVKSGGPYAENTAWCRAQLARMHLDTGAVLAAERALEPAMATAPRNYHVLAAMGRVNEVRGDLEGAIACYKRAVAVSPQLDALVALGDLYRAVGDRAAAETTYRRAEDAHEHHQEHGVHDELPMAKFWADHGRNKERALRIAREHMREGEVTNPADADAIAWVLFRCGDTAGARKMIDRALAKGAPDAARLYHAGMIYARSGENGAARKYLARALSLNPRFHLTGAPEAAATLARLGGGGPGAATVTARR